MIDIKDLDLEEKERSIENELNRIIEMDKEVYRKDYSEKIASYRSDKPYYGLINNVLLHFNKIRLFNYLIEFYINDLKFCVLQVNDVEKFEFV